MPDLLICNSREIIGVVELKYQPRARPNYSKDLETLEWIATHGSNISITNERFRGKTADARTYKLSKSVVYVWAGVHADKSITLPIPARLKSNFLELHAITTKDDDPVIRLGEKEIK